MVCCMANFQPDGLATYQFLVGAALAAIGCE